jgi:N terminus of Rad21 / Rec8 like protein
MAAGWCAASWLAWMSCKFGEDQQQERISTTPLTRRHQVWFTGWVGCALAAPAGAVTSDGKCRQKWAHVLMLLHGCSDNIMRPEVPQALRLQGILMGGVVIIYSRQTQFLLEDCKEVMVRCPQCT